MAVLGPRCCTDISLVVVSGAGSLVAVHGLLTAEASLLEEHGLSGKRVSAVAAPGLQSTGSIAAVHGLSCSACGIFLAQGLNLCLLHWQADSLPLSHQGSHEFYIYTHIYIYIYIYVTTIKKPGM